METELELEIAAELELCLELELAATLDTATLDTATELELTILLEEELPAGAVYTNVVTLCASKLALNVPLVAATVPSLPTLLVADVVYLVREFMLVPGMETLRVFADVLVFTTTRITSDPFL